MAPSPARASSRSNRDDADDDEPRNETTPLLSRPAADEDEDDQRPDRPDSPAASALLRSIQSPGAKGKRWRWPSIIALVALCTVVVLIIILAFIVPQAMEEYVQQAVVVDLDSVSIPSFTSDGVQARIQGKFKVDGSRVQKKPVRDLGRFGTWIAREVQTYEADVEVYLPEYGNVPLGYAKVPRIKVRVRDGSVTPIDVLADLTPGAPDGIRSIADDWLQGRLGQVRVKGKAQVALQSGIIYIPKQTITKELLLDDSDIPSVPAYDLSKLNVHQFETPDGETGLAVDVSVAVQNDYPVDFEIPPLAFGVLVPGCHKKDPYIMVGDALTERLHIRPKQDIEANVTGHVLSLPTELTKTCPQSDKSPLDTILGGYINGDSTTVFVRGSDSPSSDTPKWITDIIKDITVPISLKGRTLGNLIREFSLDDVHFDLPDPFAEPDSEDANPKISAIVKAIVNLPEEMNFPVDVSRVRANATVLYHGKQLGILDLHKWQKANSSRIEAHGKDGPGLAVQSVVDEAPLTITNNSLFTDVIQKLLFGGKPVLLNIHADVDVEIKTALGEIIARQIPAKGVVPVKPISRGGGNGDTPGDALGSLNPRFDDLAIVNSTKDSLTIGCLVSFTNPTKYSATIPFVDINLLVNDTILGHGTLQNVSITTGNNTKVPVTATFDPLSFGGPEGKEVSRQLISQYISGFNTTLAIQTHKGSIPSQPALGKALEALKFRFLAPRLRTPRHDEPDGDGDDEDSGTFIRQAVMHLWSSTAQFTLASPLAKNTLYITSLNATSYYKGDAVGQILYELPFAVPPGLSDTPRLPVDWSLGSVGYEAIRKAIGGELRLSATADVGVRLGEFEEMLWFKGKSIGAKVRI